MITWTVSVFVGLCLLVDGVEGGECCKAHDGFLSLPTNDEMWCEDYCCHMATYYYCCDDITLQAASLQREDMCSDYFAQNVWAPILISIGCLGSLIGCCVCCWCCCCKSNNSVGGAVIMSPGAANPSVTVVNTTNTVSHQPPPMTIDPYHSGYNQGQK